MNLYFILIFIHAKIQMEISNSKNFFRYKKKRKKERKMLFDEEKPSTTNSLSIRNRRHIQPPSAQGAICLFTY